MDKFTIKHYNETLNPIIKGNGFDGLIIGEDKQEAEEFITPINKMIDLCNEFFINCMIRPYAGANMECMYCGAIEKRDGSVNHSANDCPYLEYKSILQ